MKLPGGNQHESNQYQSFIDRCLKVNPEDRPDIDQLLLDPFLANAGQFKPKWVENFREFMGINDNNSS